MRILYRSPAPFTAVSQQYNSVWKRQAKLHSTKGRPLHANLHSSAPQVSISRIIYGGNHMFVSHMLQITRAHIYLQNPFISCQFPV